ncbi:MAG: four helix bundle protein [Gemmatimonadota bacterium]|nr:four helix bundle protein [Gemmatimonadota bacterium]MDE3216172.1 four helix bundle protein [Gemmatimonadota bacterium]
MTSGTVRDLRVWDAARLLAVEVQRAATGARARETADLWAQTRRAAESVGANIAEGCGRSTTPDRRRFFVIALGSVRETQHHLRLCRDYELIPEPQFLRLVGLAGVTRRMLESLIATMGPPER